MKGLIGNSLFSWNWKHFTESVLKYAYTLRKKIENVRKRGKKWDFKKLYIKTKKKLEVKSWAYKLMPKTLSE